MTGPGETRNDKDSARSSGPPPDALPPNGVLARLFGLAYDRPITVFWVIVLVCALLAVADFFYEKHGHYAVEDFPASYGIFGFVCFVFIVYVGKWLRHLVMRDEDYYDR